MSSGLSFFNASLTELDRVNSIEDSRSRREVEVRLRTALPHKARPGDRPHLCGRGPGLGHL